MKRYILLLLLFTQGVLYAQVEFKAVPSKTKLGVNERLRIEFVMNEDGDNFVPPSFDGFRAQGPSQMISNSWINGRRTFSKSYTYLLIPTSRGEFTIGQASIEIDGKTYKTSPIKITVTDAVKLDDPVAQARQSAAEGIHLVAEISNTNPYINEPVSVVYKLYVSPTSSVTNFYETESPKFNDFWSQTDRVDPQNIKVQKGTFKGEEYRYVVLQRTVLYPQKSGRLELEPLMLNVTMEVPTGRRGGLGFQVYDKEDKIVSSGKKYINVKALPEAGRPDDFTGAVGNFDFKVTPSKTQLDAGESLQLDVTVSGKGNLKLFTLPKPVVPSALEMYDPEHKEDISVPLSGMNGKVSDIYTIVPQNKGKYPVNALSFSYFNPATGKYKTITSQEIMIDVTGEAVASASGTGQKTKQAVTAKGQFRFVELETKLLAKGRQDFFGSGLFYGLLFLPFLLIPVIVFVRKKKEAYDSDIVGSKIRQSNKLARKYLSAAKKQLGNKEPFYVALEKALHNFLKAKLTIETSEMSKPNIQELLLSRNAAPETVDDFIKIMNNCEFARYAPSSNVAMQQDYESAVAVITALEKQVN